MPKIDVKKDYAELIVSKHIANARDMISMNGFAGFAKAEIEQSIVARFERQVQDYPDRLALKSGDRALTYAALNRAANRIAHALLARCGEAPEPIGILLTPGIAPVVAILGILKAGKFYVPLDPGRPQERLAAIVGDAGPRIILTDHTNVASVRSLVDGRAQLINIDALSPASDCNPGLAIAPDAYAYLLYTSGSTGQPKGVIQNHRNVLHQLASYAKGLTIAVEDRLTLLHSYGFSASRLDIFGALLSGAGLFHFSVADEGLANLARWLREEEITLLHWVPSAFRQFAGVLDDSEQFPSLRFIVLGSEALSVRDIASYKKHFSPDCVLVNRFGTTETGNITWHFIDKQTALTGGTVPVGRAIEDTEVLLLNETGKEVADGEAGEIAVKSRYLPPGYWRRPELTHAAFTFDASGIGLYRTGDLGYRLADGSLVCAGRKDFQVKVRGYRIETAEIESALMQHAEVKQAAVVACDDECGDKRLIAYVVGAGLQLDKLRADLKAKLPDYMMPSSFVALDQMPLTPNGKLDRKALPRPDNARSDAVAYAAPRTLLEQQLVAIFAAVLKIDRVGIRDKFFDLGGHSLLAMQIVSRIREALKIEVPLLALFEAPTVADLATSIETMRAEEGGLRAPPIVPVSRNRALPLSFPQLRIWFFDQLHPGSPVYNIPHALRTGGQLDIEALRKALNSVVARHESLRTSFAISANGEPHQVIVPRLDLPLPLIDLHELPEGEREAKAAQLIREEGRRGFD